VFDVLEIEGEAECESHAKSEAPGQLRLFRVDLVTGRERGSTFDLRAEHQDPRLRRESLESREVLVMGLQELPRTRNLSAIANGDRTERQLEAANVRIGWSTRWLVLGMPDSGAREAYRREIVIDRKVWPADE
jgi:hypothetical protein